MRSLALILTMVFAFIAPISAQTFSDNFNAGKLDTSNWEVLNKIAPGSTPTHTSLFNSHMLDFSQGMLRIAVTQVVGPRGTITSTGGEIKTTKRYGYGKYEFVMRLATTSPTPDGPGKAVSGSLSSGFTYFNNSQTEIDFEFIGTESDNLYMTNWISLTKNQQTKTTISNLANGFHNFTFVWHPGVIEWYVDGRFIKAHTKNVPTEPAYIEILHRGTDARWGGGATSDGISRYFYMKSVTFIPWSGR